MTETHHHNGQNPTPAAGIIAVLVVTAYAATALTPDQLEHLLLVLGAPGVLLGLARALEKA